MGQEQSCTKLIAQQMGESPIMILGSGHDNEDIRYFDNDKNVFAIKKAIAYDIRRVCLKEAETSITLVRSRDSLRENVLAPSPSISIEYFDNRVEIKFPTMLHYDINNLSESYNKDLIISFIQTTAPILIDRMLIDRKQDDF